MDFYKKQLLPAMFARSMKYQYNEELIKVAERLILVAIKNNKNQIEVGIEYTPVEINYIASQGYSIEPMEDKIIISW